MPPERYEFDLDKVTVFLPDGETAEVKSNIEEIALPDTGEKYRPHSLEFTANVNLEPVKRPRQKMVDRAMRLMRTTEGKRLMINSLLKAKLNKEVVRIKARTEVPVEQVEVDCELC